MILGWYLYRVHYTGSADKYNYVTVTLFADRSQLEAPWAGIDPSEVMPDVDINEFYEKTLASRDMVGSNLISRIESVYGEGGPGDFKFLQIDYMKVKCLVLEYGYRLNIVFTLHFETPRLVFYTLKIYEAFYYYIV